MKKSVILDIFNGERGHRETMKMPDGHFEKSQTADAYDELIEKLSPELLELHKKFTDALNDDHYEEVNFFFVEGFKLGLLTGIECAEE